MGIYGNEMDIEGQLKQTVVSKQKCEYFVSSLKVMSQAKTELVTKVCESYKLYGPVCI